MCVMSMIMDHAFTTPKDIWQAPSYPDDLKKLLEEAKKYDEMTGQPDCELDEKRLALKKIADEMGVKIDFL